MHVLELFESNETMDCIFSRESIHRAGAMLIDARKQIGRDSDVEGAVRTAGEDVNTGLLHKLPACGGMDAETSSA
jgi:hypothetical protein